MPISLLNSACHAMTSRRSSPKYTVIALATLVTAVSIMLGSVAMAADRSTVSSFAPQNGISMASWWVTGFAGSRAIASLDELAATGANWVAFVVTQYQSNIRSTDIGKTNGTVDDADLIDLIRHAHTLGLGVTLKPHVDLHSDPRRNRAHIGSAFESEGEWENWFSTYTDFIVHYAELAEENRVEQLVIGTELAGTTHRDDDWRGVVEQVRDVYGGSLTYASLDSESLAITWWDALDVIGVDAYYVLTSDPDPSKLQLERGWRPYLDALNGLSERWGMPILLTEIGYTSVSGTTSKPWDWNLPGPIDLEEQALAYEVALEQTSQEPWFIGMYWWYWHPDLTVGGPDDRGYSPSCKPAAEVLRAWYGGDGQQTCPQ